MRITSYLSPADSNRCLSSSCLGIAPLCSLHKTCVRATNAQSIKLLDNFILPDIFCQHEVDMVCKVKYSLWDCNTTLQGSNEWNCENIFLPDLRPCKFGHVTRTSTLGSQLPRRTPAFRKRISGLLHAVPYAGFEPATSPWGRSLQFQELPIDLYGILKQAIPLMLVSQNNCADYCRVNEEYSENDQHEFGFSFSSVIRTAIRSCAVMEGVEPA